MQLKSSCCGISYSARVRGASLLEVLISMIVLSLGMLGYASLILKSQTYTTAANFRSQATIAANSVIESARSNKAQLANYVCSSPCAAPPQTTQAGKDLALFRSALEALPSSTASIGIDASNKITVTVNWAETDGNTYSFVTSSWIK